MNQRTYNNVDPMVLCDGVPMAPSTTEAVAAFVFDEPRVAESIQLNCEWHFVLTERRASEYLAYVEVPKGRIYGKGATPEEALDSLGEQILLVRELGDGDDMAEWRAIHSSDPLPVQRPGASRRQHS